MSDNLHRVIEDRRDTNSDAWTSNGSIAAPHGIGGARRNRTDDLLLAKQALSQLSYGPDGNQGSGIRRQVKERVPDA